MYIQDEEASVRVPIWQLAAFKRVQVESGGESRVRICIRARDLAVIRQDGTGVLEPGMFKLYVGGSQPDEVSRRLTDEAVWEGCFEMAGEETEIPY